MVMVGKPRRVQESLELVGSLRELVPDDHLLVQIDKVLDLSWVRDEVRHLYSDRLGRPSIDPESALRLMLAGALLGIVHDRALMRAAQDSLAIRWFAGYSLWDRLPDHSSLTRIRQRWGAVLFGKLLDRTVSQCVEAGLVGGSTVHVDATLMRANASFGSFVREHVSAVVDANSEGEAESLSPEGSADDEAGPWGDIGLSGGGSSGSTDRPQAVGALGGESSSESASRGESTKRMSRSDGDARLARKQKGERCDPAYKVHAVADDEQGIVVDVRVTRADVAEGHELMGQLDGVRARTGTPVAVVVADAGYGHARNYGELESRGCAAVIPSQAPKRHRGGMPAFRFKHDARHDVVRCPRGAKLRRCRENEEGVTYKARVSDCSRCPLQGRCVPAKSKVRSILIVHGHSALVRARRAQWRGEIRGTPMYSRRFFLAEGVFAWAKRQFGLARASRRGLWTVGIQANLAFAAMNLRRLGAHRAILSVSGSFQRLFMRLLGCVGPIRGLWGLVRPSGTPALALAA